MPLSQACINEERLSLLSCRVKKAVRFPACTPVPKPTKDVSSPDAPSFTFCTGSVPEYLDCPAFSGFENRRWAVPNERARTKFLLSIFNNFLSITFLFYSKQNTGTFVCKRPCVYCSAFFFAKNRNFICSEPVLDTFF